MTTLREHLEAMMETRSVPGDAGSAFEVIEEHGLAARHNFACDGASEDQRILFDPERS